MTESRIHRDARKVIAVINSCETFLQTIVAKRLVALFVKKYSNGKKLYFDSIREIDDVFFDKFDKMKGK
jgi:hypothetical protein